MTNVVKQKSVKSIIEWTVKIPRNEVTIESETFLFLCHECNLKLRLGCSVDKKFPSTHLYFNYHGELKAPINVSVRLANACHILNDSEQRTIKNISATNTIIWSSSRSDFLKEVLLTIRVIIYAYPSTDDKPVQISTYKDACFSMEGLSHDFSKLLDEGPYHDVEFTCGDQTIKAHKNILCSRSNVFASMLQSDMAESNTGQINIQNMDAAIFRQFLRCLYTGMLPELTVDSAFQFYEASDKYGVDEVMKQCADFLIDSLSVENACEILILADSHSDIDFKKSVMEYVIKEKIPYVGEKWTDFCNKNSILAVEVYKLFFEEIRPN